MSFASELNLQSNARFRIDDRTYVKWLGDRRNFFAGKYDLSAPTLKNAVCLALIDTLGKSVSYNEIERRIVWAGVLFDFEFEESLDAIPPDALRMAVSQVAKQLRAIKAPYFLKAHRDEKNRGLYRLVQAPDEMARLAEMSRIRRGRQPDGAAPSEIARRLVADAGGLPFAAMYVNYRAAASWIYEEKNLGTVRSLYEAGALDAYSLKKLLPKHSGNLIGLVGLGVGEGQGEVAVLRKLLLDSENAFQAIHYLAVDSSEMLLSSHACLVRDLFREEIESGRLIFCPVQGDLFRLLDQVGVARERFGDTFLSGMSILSTYLGNNFGNQEDQEWLVFQSLFSAFVSPTPVAVLLGVSLMRRENDEEQGKVLEEQYRLDSLTLDTPRALIQEQRLLVSCDESGTELSPIQSLEFTERGVLNALGTGPIPSTVYKTASGLSGRVYRFHYSLIHGLKCRETGDSLPRGARVHLASIVKYDLRSVCQTLERKGLRVLAPPKNYEILKAEDGDKHYRYVVIGLTRS